MERNLTMNKRKRISIWILAVGDVQKLHVLKYCETK